jgi:GNAT superfamily N-acetyltransferase
MLQSIRSASPLLPATGRTPAVALEIAPAGVEDRDIVLGLIEDAREWLWTKDTDQWENPWPNERERDARVMKGVQGRKTWIVWDGDIAAATATITPQRNIEVWSNPSCTCNLRERAVFVHRLITARKYAGLGLGAQLIDWAGLRSQRLYGAKWIRIDVWSTNSALHNYYQGIGFERCGECLDPNYPSGALFQKPVAGIKKPSAWLFSECTDQGQPTTLDLLAAGSALS